MVKKSFSVWAAEDVAKNSPKHSFPELHTNLHSHSHRQAKHRPSTRGDELNYHVSTLPSRGIAVTANDAHDHGEASEEAVERWLKSPIHASQQNYTNNSNNDSTRHSHPGVFFAGTSSSFPLVNDVRSAVSAPGDQQQLRDRLRKRIMLQKEAANKWRNLESTRVPQPAMQHDDSAALQLNIARRRRTLVVDTRSTAVATAADKVQREKEQSTDDILKSLEEVHDTMIVSEIVGVTPSRSGGSPAQRARRRAQDQQQQEQQQQQQQEQRPSEVNEERDAPSHRGATVVVEVTPQPKNALGSTPIRSTLSSIGAGVRTNAISLHIYDLIPSEVIMQLPFGCEFPLGQCFGALNSSLHSLGTGAYHVGIEVNGIEYAYGANSTAGATGIFTCFPKKSPNYQYRTTVDFGKRVLKRTAYIVGSEVRYTPPTESWQRYQEVDRYVDGREVLREMAREYMGVDYDLLRKNCCTFAHDASVKLGIPDEEIPSWFRNLAAAGAVTQDAARSATQPISNMLVSCDCDNTDDKVDEGGFEVFPQLSFIRNDTSATKEKKAADTKETIVKQTESWKL